MLKMTETVNNHFSDLYKRAQEQQDDSIHLIEYTPDEVAYGFIQVAV